MILTSKAGREMLGMAFTLIMCGGFAALSAQQAEVRTEGGVVIVRNPVDPVPGRGPSKLVLEHELTIGLHEKDRDFHFQDVGAVRADGAGNIFVLDRRACQVKKFSAEGEFLGGFGRSGQGPGEFGPPNGFHIIADKEILVSSFGRLSYFDLNGSFLRHTAAIFWGAPVPDSVGRLIAETMMPNGGPPRFAREVRVFDPEAKSLALIHRHEFVMPADGDVHDAFPDVTYYAVRPDDSIVWGTTDRFELTISNQRGEVQGKILKDYDPVKLTAEDVKATESQLAPGGRYAFPSHFPPFRSFHLDDRGRIFVRTYERAAEGQRCFDVFDEDGVFFAKILLPEAPMSWRAGKLYAVAEDSDGFLQVKRFRARWE